MDGKNLPSINSIARAGIGIFTLILVGAFVTIYMDTPSRYNELQPVIQEHAINRSKIFINIWRDLTEAAKYAFVSVIAYYLAKK